jgi:hypothetical protein
VHAFDKKAERGERTRKAFGSLALFLFFTSLVVLGAACLGIDVQESAPGVWLLHVGIEQE